jgi:CRP-like cAMP-binding protein
MYQELFDHISRYITLEASDEELIAEHLQYRELPKKGFLLREGTTCHHHHFILRGCVRLYFTTEKGKEQIIQFGIDNWWITDLNSLEQQSPSPFYIQALEPTAVALLDREAANTLFEKIPRLERYFRLVMQRAYAASTMRFYYLYCQSNAERYRHFNAAFPDFVQRIPQYMLASYLGFSPEFLSRVRAGKA